MDMNPFNNDNPESPQAPKSEHPVITGALRLGGGVKRIQGALEGALGAGMVLTGNLEGFGMMWEGAKDFGTGWIMKKGAQGIDSKGIGKSDQEAGKPILGSMNSSPGSLESALSDSRSHDGAQLGMS